MSTEAGIKALQKEADMLYSNTAVKKAYNHYKTLEALCEVPKKEEEK